MPSDINELDVTDAGLKSIFGDRFHDETEVASEPPKMHKPAKELWEPEKPSHNWLDNLKACVKHAAVFGGLSCLIFYWQQAGLMDPTIAVPSMCVCTARAGLGVGKNVNR